MAGYLVSEQSVTGEYVVKKSRFIAQLHTVRSREQAMELLDKAKQNFRDARHHCWAYQIGDPKNPTLVAMSDDGEPGGTAGKPILNVIQHKNIGDVMVIVIRYFGGIKLGAGGLVRAYSSATQQAFEACTLVQQLEVLRQTIQCTFAEEQRLRHAIAQLGGTVMATGYDHHVTLTVDLETSAIEKLRLVTDSMSGAELIKLPVIDDAGRV